MKKIIIISLLCHFLAFSFQSSAAQNRKDILPMAPNSPWESIPKPHYNVYVERMSVPHGWIVITYSSDNTTTTIFVPERKSRVGIMISIFG